jgi:hypothetical protein
MAHPDLGLFPGREAAEELAFDYLDRRAAVLPPARTHDGASRQMRDQLHAIAETQNRHVQVQQLLGCERRPVVVHRIGTPGQNDSPRIPGPDPVERAAPGVDLGVDVGLANPPRDELGELGAVVENQDAVVMAHRACLGPVMPGLPRRSGNPPAPRESDRRASPGGGSPPSVRRRPGFPAGGGAHCTWSS